MKRKMFSIMAIAAIAFASCKKEEAVSTQLGEAVINGNIYADLDYTNDLDGAGLYDQGLINENVEGLTISVEVNTSNYDQTPEPGYAYDIKTYTATTDASGNYSLTIPATEDAFEVFVQLGYVYTTRKSYAVDGVTVLEENVKVGGNTLPGMSIYSGAVLTASNDASVTYVDGGTEEYGEVIVRGVAYADWNAGNTATVFYDTTVAGSPLAGQTLKFTYTEAPYNNGTTNVFTAVIAADGTYSITVPSELTGMDDVDVAIDCDDFYGDQIQDDGNGTSTDMLVPSIYSLPTYNVNTMYDGDIRLRDLYFDVTNL